MIPRACQCTVSTSHRGKGPKATYYDNVKRHIMWHEISRVFRIGSLRPHIQISLSTGKPANELHGWASQAIQSSISEDSKHCRGGSMHALCLTCLWLSSSRRESPSEWICGYKANEITTSRRERWESEKRKEKAQFNRLIWATSLYDATLDDLLQNFSSPSTRIILALSNSRRKEPKFSFFSQVTNALPNIDA